MVNIGVGYTGTKIEPAFTGIMCAYNYYCGAGDTAPGGRPRVKPGDIKKLLVLETLPMPIHYTGGMDPISYGGSYTLNRVLGTVPVEADGSVNALVPPLRSLQLVALDAQDLSVKRMLSFLMMMFSLTEGVPAQAAPVVTIPAR